MRRVMENVDWILIGCILIGLIGATVGWVWLGLPVG